MAESLSLASGEQLDVKPAEPTTGEPSVASPPKRAEKDPEAPHGRRADGTAKRGPGGRPSKPRVVSGPSEMPAVDKAAIAKEATETVQFVAVICDLAGKSAENTALRADAVVLNSASEALGGNLAEVAAISPLVAKFLTGGGKFAPWAGLCFTGYQVAMSIQENHRNPQTAAAIVAATEPQQQENSDAGSVHPEE